MGCSPLEQLARCRIIQSSQLLAQLPRRPLPAESPSTTMAAALAMQMRGRAGFLQSHCRLGGDQAAAASLANSLAAPCSTFFTIDLLDAAGMDWAMCGDLEALHDAECLVLEGAATDVHLWQVVHRCNRVLAWVHEHSHYSGSH